MSMFRRSQFAHPAPGHTLSTAQAPGRLRQVCVSATVLTSLVAAAAVGAAALWVAYQPERLTLAQAEPLQGLQPWLPGQVLQVPATSGLWATHSGGGRLLLAQAAPDGPAQTVSLCDQIWGGLSDPLSLYPMSLMAGLPPAGADKATRHRSLKQPIVLSAQAGAGLPPVWVQGRLAEADQPAQLELRVAPTADAAQPTWGVALAKPLVEAHTPTQGPSVGQRAFELGAEAWVLWDPIGRGQATGDAGPPALDGSAPGFRRGVRVRRVGMSQCKSGGLEWQLFDATASGRHPQGAAMLMWQAPEASPVAPVLRLAVRAGTHRVPELAAEAMEDRVLFQNALQERLLQPLPDGRMAVAPSDQSVHPLLKTLHRSANGQHVLSQVRLTNQDRHWLALRLRAAAGAPLPVATEPARWHVSAQGELVEWAMGLPPVAARLQSAPSPGFTPWVRLLPPGAWALPAATQGAAAKSAPPVLRVAIPRTGADPGRRSVPLEVLVLGQVHQVEGARVLADEPACDGPGCAAGDVVRRLTLLLHNNAQELVLTLSDQPAFNRLNPSAAAQRKVQWRRGQPTWVENTVASGAEAVTPAEVRVLASDGQTLYDQGAPTALAQTLGLLPVVGLGPQHGAGLASSLARLGAQGQARVVATTTLEPRYQHSLNAVLACQGQQGGQWLSAEQRCAVVPDAAAPPEGRITAAVLLDARQGGILAASAGRPVTPGLSADELLAFHAFNPAASPLAVPAWQHNGGVTQAPGSAYKVVDALMLEQQAQSSPALAAWLAGVPGDALATQARAAGLQYSAASPCYPAPCVDDSSPQVENYRGGTPLRYEEQGRFGLVQALRHSLNTWFAMLAEHTDRTLRTGHADARPLGNQALLAERPLLAMGARLGLGEALQLDGGLLPAEHRWAAGDVLAASPTRHDPLLDAHSVRQQALGLRMQTTPLHMARVAAGVATGQVPAVHVLQQLNGVAAVPTPPKPLGIGLERVRRGMHEVALRGTASGALSLPLLEKARTHVHGKTGTAPLASKPKGARCDAQAPERALPSHCLHNAWFIGYLEPGALPGETRTLAFAVQVSHTRQTGGAAAAGVVAAWLADHWARAGDAAKPVPANP